MKRQLLLMYQTNPSFEAETMDLPTTDVSVPSCAVL